MSVSNPSLKSAVSVSEMAELCGFSRSRWYELLDAQVFPPPVILVPNSRPIYGRELIETCLQIKQTGIGLNGMPVIFNRKLNKTRPVKSQSKEHSKIGSSNSELAPVVDAIKSLGMSTSAQAVADAVTSLFPNGISDQDHGEVIRKTFLFLQGKRP
ncbi:helix-turn-helix transcriptional regulator [Planctomicrobium sp. SH527]|uniref:helix-turn-helix transcriptional regulator n=1 Tax=Planctomicrobium sp. SH527 TaxID=3448123 RepID=UPI003F5C3545